MEEPIKVREACRRRMPLDGVDAECLEHALTITERERDTARADAASLAALLREAMEFVTDAHGSTSYQRRAADLAARIDAAPGVW